MTYLCSYLVDTQNNLSAFEVDSYFGSDLNGNEPYVLSQTQLPGYKDISSIENWWYMYEHQNDILLFRDYKYVRNEIMVIAYFSEWSNLSQNEKEICSKIFAVGKTERDEIHTISQQIENGLLHHTNSMESRQSRLMHAQIELFNRIDKDHWEEIGSHINYLIPIYTNNGREGTIEGDPEGLFDYIDGSNRTNTSWDGTGTFTGFRDEDYVIDGFASCSDFADYILSILKYGNYEYRKL